jgi:hypothetical protein
VTSAAQTWTVRKKNGPGVSVFNLVSGAGPAALPPVRTMGYTGAIPNVVFVSTCMYFIYLQHDEFVTRDLKKKCIFLNRI